MSTIRENGLVGGLMWSIRGHRRDGGWYYHNEGGTPVNSFHVPGFAAGYSYEESRLLDLLSKEAWLIRGEAAPPIQVPSPAPVLMRQGEGLTWRGSAGAAFYTIERREGPAAAWHVLATGLHDSVVQDVKSFEYSPATAEALVLFCDETASAGKTWQYRIKGTNSAGDSGWSDILQATW
jgi:mannan endo-1,4-beta-mannosidase